MSIAVVVVVLCCPDEGVVSVNLLWVGLVVLLRPRRESDGVSTDD